MLDFEVFRSGQVERPSSTDTLRRLVREFLASELSVGSYEPRCNAWLEGHDPEFSRRLGEHGWIGMTWPRQYGGDERSALERFVVSEELLTAGAPVAAHWIAERQSGPALLRFGTERQRQRFLPAIARGECFFGIGMSEPGAGSDLAAVSTRGRRVEGGWRVRGNKTWTSNADKSDFLIALCRTEERGEDRHSGLTQFLVDLQCEGLTVRPIELMDGGSHFSELFFDDVFIPDDMVLGQPGQGWVQVTAELANERSGPERFLSTYPLFREMWDQGVDARRHPLAAEAVARLWTLRQMSRSVAGCLERGRSPAVEAALVKDEGTAFESELIDLYRRVIPDRRRSPMLDDAQLASPGFTLRGGTTEVLRGIVARGLGAR